MTSPQLIDYIKQQTKIGKSREEITSLLLAQGWKATDVEEAFAVASNQAQGVPLPPQISEQGVLPKIGALFSESLELLKDRIMVMFVSALVPVLSAAAAGGLIFLFGFIINKSHQLTGRIIMVAAGILGALALIYAILWGAVSYFTALRDRDEKTGIKENIKRSRPLIWSFLLANLIFNLTVVGGTILFLVPGIILGVYYGFASIIMISEGKKGRMALAQSKAYVYGKAWKVFGRLFLLNLLILAVYILLYGLAYMTKNTGMEKVINIISFIFQFLSSFYLLAFQFTLYKHLKSSSGPTNPEVYMRGVTGWTIWGAIGGVIAILALTVSIILLSLNSARVTSRDSKRIADMRKMASALGLYYIDNNSYPQQLTTPPPDYLGTVPEAPKPADGKCTETNNRYSYQLIDPDHYRVLFCLGKPTGGLPAGELMLTESGVYSIDSE